jgi:hypothetical protein
MPVYRPALALRLRCSTRRRSPNCARSTSASSGGWRRRRRSSRCRCRHREQRRAPGAARSRRPCSWRRRASGSSRLAPARCGFACMHPTRRCAASTCFVRRRLGARRLRSPGPIAVGARAGDGTLRRQSRLPAGARAPLPGRAGRLRGRGPVAARTRRTGARRPGAVPDRRRIGWREPLGRNLLRLRDRHGVTGAFRAANLVYGCYDFSMTPSQRLWGERRLPLTTAAICWFADQYARGRSGA